MFAKNKCPPPFLFKILKGYIDSYNEASDLKLNK